MVQFDLEDYVMAESVKVSMGDKAMIAEGLQSLISSCKRAQNSAKAEMVKKAYALQEQELEACLARVRSW